MIFLDIYWRKKASRIPPLEQKPYRKTIPTITALGMILILILIINNFLQNIVVLITRHDQLANTLNKDHGYGAPYYTTYFFNKEVGLHFVRLLNLLITTLQIIVISLIIFFVISYCRRYYLIKYTHSFSI